MSAAWHSRLLYRIDDKRAEIGAAVGRPISAPGNRDALIKEFMAAGGKLIHDEIVARNRAVTA